MYRRKEYSHSTSNIDKSRENSISFLKNELNKAKNSVKFLKEENSLLNTMYEKTAASYSALPKKSPKKVHKTFLDSIKAKKTDYKAFNEMSKTFSEKIKTNFINNNVSVNNNNKSDTKYFNPLYKS